MKEKHTAEYPMVSVVSVNWKQRALTEVMLDSLREVDYPHLDIWVVDNGSPEGGLEGLKQAYPEVNVIISPDNLGFAGGNNLALPQVVGKYVLLLNNDTEVDPGFLQPMVDLMESDEQIGIVSPKIFFYDQPEVLQYAGTTLIHPITNRGKKFGYGEKDEGKYEEVCETGFPNGACMLVRRSLFERLGLLYENYFIYYEEHDFAHRSRKAGYKIYFQPKSRIYHKVSASTGQDSPFKIYYMHRNRQVFNRRNYKGLTFLLSSLYYFFVATPKALLKYLISWNIPLFHAIIRASLWHGRHPHLPLNRPSVFVEPQII